MTKTELKKYIGKIIAKDNNIYVWLFKLIDVQEEDNGLIVTQGMDLIPKPSAYHISFCESDDFNDLFIEPHVPEITRVPTKEELKLYRQYTRELRLLGTNKSMYGTK